MITLVLADDHPLILLGLKQLFAQEPDFRVLACCATGAEALEAVRRHRPEILVLDLRLPGKDGLTVLREMRAEGLSTRVVILTGALHEDLVVEAVHLGAHGVVLKEMAPKFLVECIRKVHAGDEWFEKRSIGHILGRIRQRDAKAQDLALLTKREREIVYLVVQDLSNQEIAKRLSIGEGTVKLHLHNVYAKLQVAGRLALLLYAREHGLNGSPAER